MEKYRAKKNITSTIVVASLIMSGVAAAGTLAYLDNDNIPTIALRVGDELIYQLNGVDNGSEVAGSVNCHITKVLWLKAASYLTGDMADEVEERYNLPLVESTGILINTMWISTALGPKLVKEYLDYKPLGNGKEPIFVFSYRGVDSYVPYRVNISAPTYSLSAELLDGTNSGLNRWDSIERDVEVPLRNPSADRSLRSYIYENGSHSSSSVSYVLEGTTIRCSSDVNTSNVYLFTDDNLSRMRSGAVWQFDTSLSLISGSNSSGGIILKDGLLFILANPDHSAEQGIVTIEIDRPG